MAKGRPWTYDVQLLERRTGEQGFKGEHGCGKPEDSVVAGVGGEFFSGRSDKENDDTRKSDRKVTNKINKKKLSKFTGLWKSSSEKPVKNETCQKRRESIARKWKSRRVYVCRRRNKYNTSYSNTPKRSNFLTNQKRSLMPIFSGKNDSDLRYIDKNIPVSVNKNYLQRLGYFWVGVVWAVMFSEFCVAFSASRTVRTKYGDVSGVIVTPDNRYLDAVEVRTTML